MIEVGGKFKADTEKQRYTVQARDARFVIMTKPFNARKTYLYTIVDLTRGIRGPCNLIFGPPYDLSDQGGALAALRMLQAGEMGISHRRDVALSNAEAAQIDQSSKVD